MPGGSSLDVRRAVAEDLAAGERFDSLYLGWDKKRRLAWREWRGDFNQRVHGVLPSAVEAQSALGDVFALDDFVRVRWVAHARAKVDANAHVLASVYAAPAGIQQPRWRGNVLGPGRGRSILRRCRPELWRLKHCGGAGSRSRNLNIGQ